MNRVHKFACSNLHVCYKLVNGLKLDNFSEDANTLTVFLEKTLLDFAIAKNCFFFHKL